MFLAGLNGLMAVTVLAVSAHGLETRLPIQQISWLARGAEFQLWHALALLGLAALQASGGAPRRLVLSGTAFQLGIMLFCGSLYWLGWQGADSLGAWGLLTPAGGLALLIGWALLALSGVKFR